jgi:hypothetical protein
MKKSIIFLIVFINIALFVFAYPVFQILENQVDDTYITYGGQEYTLWGWQEKRFIIKKKYIIVGESWIYPEYRIQQVGQYWSKWKPLSNPFPCPPNYNNHSMQVEVADQPQYQFDSGFLLKRTNSDAKNGQSIWWEDEYLHFIAAVYLPSD